MSTTQRIASDWGWVELDQTKPLTTLETRVVIEFPIVDHAAYTGPLKGGVDANAKLGDVVVIKITTTDPDFDQLTGKLVAWEYKLARMHSGKSWDEIKQVFDEAAEEFGFQADQLSVETDRYGYSMHLIGRVSG
jgi:hypothetical protein